MKLIIFISLLVICYNQKVISRNGKITEMINEIKDDQLIYDQLIELTEKKINKNYEECTNEIQNQNCSETEVWQQQRSKNSKNITNLQQKIKTYNKTIDAILQLNKHEVIKQNLTMATLFPKIEKVKNDIELIENMMFLIEDTYLNLDVAGKSIFLLFDHQFNHASQQIQQSFLQLMNKKAYQEEENVPIEEKEETQQKANDSPTDNLTKPAQDIEQSEPEKKKNQTDDIPLIDEEIFTGEVDQTEIEVSNLFAPTEEEKKQLYADTIPDAINVKEHDSSEFDKEINEEKKKNQEENDFEDLRIYEVKEDFKNSIKELGKNMHEQLKIVSEKLNKELSQLTQSVADLEKSIIDLHHKHAKQIVQIYMETKKLQQTIFQLDDQILSFDAQIFDCQNSNEKLQICENQKSMDYIIFDDLKTEKSFNEGILVELEKLLQFEDKNIYEPETIQQTEIPQEEPKSKEQIEQNLKDQKTQERIQQIKNEEKLVEEQLEKENQLQIQEQSKQPEHLSEIPEIKEEAPVTPVINPENSSEEDKILEEIENELKEEGEPSLEEPTQNIQTPAKELPAIEEQKKQETQPQLEFLKKNKKK